jgi:uncharacterized membrane protein YraQ (UPF0718 family)
MIRRILDKIGLNWVFLIAVVVLYGAVGVADPSLIGRSLQAFLRMLARIAPALAIVYALLFLTNLFVDTSTVMKLLGRRGGVVSWLVVIAAGILSAGPIYLWYPLMADLREKGMRHALVATFLYNRAVKIPLLPVMIHYFGVKLVVILTIFMIGLSVADGIVVERIVEMREGSTERNST